MLDFYEKIVYNSTTLKMCGGIAQSVEQQPFKLLVAGSIPATLNFYEIYF